MKKIISLVLALVIAIGCVACSSIGEVPNENTETTVSDSVILQNEEQPAVPQKDIPKVYLSGVSRKKDNVEVAVYDEKGTLREFYIKNGGEFYIKNGAEERHRENFDENGERTYYYTASAYEAKGEEYVDGVLVKKTYRDKATTRETLYDANGVFVQKTEDRYDSIDKYRVITTVVGEKDENGRLIKENCSHEIIYDEGVEANEFAEEYYRPYVNYYNYDDAGRLISITQSSRFSDEVFVKEEWVYNDTDSTAVWTEYEVPYSADVNYGIRDKYEYAYTYSANGTLIGVHSRRLDISWDEWETIKYNEAGEVIYKESWMGYFQDYRLYEYDDNGNLTRYISYDNENKESSFNTNEAYTYDEDGRLIKEEEFDFDTGALVSVKNYDRTWPENLDEMTAQYEQLPYPLTLLPVSSADSSLANSMKESMFAGGLSGVISALYVCPAKVVCTDASGTLLYQTELKVDEENRTREVVWTAGETQPTTYKLWYDEAGNIEAASKTFENSGKEYTVSYELTYDENGRLSDVTWMDGSSHTYLSVAYTYDQDGNLIKEYVPESGGAWSTTFTYTPVEKAD